MPEGDPRTARPAPWRRRTASGVVATAMAIGVRSALEELPAGEAIVVDVPGDSYDPSPPSSCTSTTPAPPRRGPSPVPGCCERSPASRARPLRRA